MAASIEETETHRHIETNKHLQIHTDLHTYIYTLGYRTKLLNDEDVMVFSCVSHSSKACVKFLFRFLMVRWFVFDLTLSNGYCDTENK